MFDGTSFRAIFIGGPWDNMVRDVPSGMDRFMVQELDWPDPIPPDGAIPTMPEIRHYTYIRETHRFGLGGAMLPFCYMRHDSLSVPEAEDYLHASTPFFQQL